jgi:hypothetical protein
MGGRGYNEPIQNECSVIGAHFEWGKLFIKPRRVQSTWERRFFGVILTKNRSRAVPKKLKKRSSKQDSMLQESVGIFLEYRCDLTEFTVVGLD